MENRKTIFLWGGGKIKIESKRNTKPNKRYIKKNQTIAQKRKKQRNIHMLQEKKKQIHQIVIKIEKYLKRTFKETVLRDFRLWFCQYMVHQM